MHSYNFVFFIIITILESYSGIRKCWEGFVECFQITIGYSKHTSLCKLIANSLHNFSQVLLLVCVFWAESYLKWLQHVHHERHWLIMSLTLSPSPPSLSMCVCVCVCVCVLCLYINWLCLCLCLCPVQVHCVLKYIHVILCEWVVMWFSLFMVS